MNLPRVAAAVLLLAGLAACSPQRPPVGVQGDPERGRIAVTQYACQSCHIIPGVSGSKVYVGRPLEDMARRKVLAGSLPHDQANLVRWIRDPQSIDPETAMPNMGVSERDALDISAFLLTR
ncbi:c-type cytochrome [Massilia sp. UMI-21]|nr:c-type cytochrome [Massilia sp. UMI-21]